MDAFRLLVAVAVWCRAVATAGRVLGRGLDAIDLGPRDVDPGCFDPRDVDPRGVDPRGVDPRGVDPGGRDPRGVDPRRVDPRRVDARGVDPGHVDPRGVDSRVSRPRGDDPRRLESWARDPSGRRCVGSIAVRGLLVECSFRGIARADVQLPPAGNSRDCKTRPLRRSTTSVPNPMDLVRLQAGPNGTFIFVPSMPTSFPVCRT